MNTVSMGQVLSRSFALMRDNLMSVGLFLLIVQVLESAFSFVLGQQSGAAMGMDQDGAGANPLQIFGMASYWLMIAFMLLSSALTWAGSIHGYVRSAYQRPVDLRECFMAGLAKMFPMLLLLILWWLAIGLGWMLLIIPALILISMWSVAMPVLVSENLSVTQSFGRSRELTRGHRMAIFGVLVMVVVVLYAGLIIVGGVAASRVNFVQMAFTAQSNPFVVIALGLAGWVMGMFVAALLSALYIELVQAKGSAPTGHLSEVFV